MPNRQITVTPEMIERASDAYEEGMQPGDEYFGDRDEVRYMAEKIIRAALDQSPSRHVYDKVGIYERRSADQSPSGEEPALLASMRPASAAHLQLTAAVLQCLEAEVDADTIRRFVEEELPQPSGEEGEGEGIVYRVEVGDNVIHFGPEVGDIERVARGWRETGATVVRYIAAHPHDQEAPQVSSGDGGLAKLKALVDRQAGDEGLWFDAHNASTAYIQQELRRLHAAIETAAELPSTLTDEDRERLERIAQKIRRTGIDDGDMGLSADEAADFLRNLAGKEQR